MKYFKIVEDFFKKIPVKYRWKVYVALAAISFLSFVHIGSYVGDKYGLNTVFTVVGIASAIAVFTLSYIAAKENNIDKDK